MSGSTYGFTLYGETPDHMLALSAKAEELGFDDVWLGEHVVAPFSTETAHPYQAHADPPVLGPETPLYDVWVMASMVLGMTRRLRVATGILQLPLRHPLLTARASVSAFQLSGGRFTLGVGLGWMPEEYQALGVPFHERRVRYDECIDVLRAVWSGGPVEHHGGKYDFPRLQMSPNPVPIPLVLGGTSVAALRRAALRADGWFNPSTATLDDCLQVRRRVDEARAEHGLSERPFTYHIRMAGDLTPEVCEAYHAAGFDKLIIPWSSMWSRTAEECPLAEKLAGMEEIVSRLGISGPGVDA